MEGLGESVFPGSSLTSALESMVSLNLAKKDSRKRKPFKEVMSWSCRETWPFSDGLFLNARSNNVYLGRCFADVPPSTAR